MPRRSGSGVPHVAGNQSCRRIWSVNGKTAPLRVCLQRGVPTNVELKCVVRARAGWLVLRTIVRVSCRTSCLQVAARTPARPPPSQPPATQPPAEAWQPVWVLTQRKAASARRVHRCRQGSGFRTGGGRRAEAEGEASVRRIPA